VTGHGGDKSYVTPYVGLFAAKPTTSTPVVKVASRTTAKYTLRTGRRGKAVVTVAASKVPTGTVVVQDKGRTIARATLKAGHDGRIAVTLPRMRKGTHRLVAKYLGSTRVKPSSAARKTITLR
jgi:hypothetical protein